MRRRNFYAIAFIGLIIMMGSRVQAQCASRLVYPGEDGRLVYVPDAQGNRIPDFSNVGYMGGVVDIPDVPVRVTLGPTFGDQTARIQAAIDQVSQIPLDENGFRGAVLLRRGEYPIGDHLEIRASGVVLRGEGDDESSGATVLRATGTSQRALVQVKGSGSRQRVGDTRNIIDKYVPVGAVTFTVDSTAGLAVGDTVIVHRPSPANWIHDIDMDQLQNPWQPGSKNIDWDRIIMDITGNQITVDAPITTAIEQQYDGGTIYKYAWPGRIENVGIENMKGQSDFTSPTDENHSWTFISLVNVQNAWVRDVASQYFAYSLVSIERSAKWVTVINCACLDPISRITGGRRYSFNVVGQLNLVKNGYARDGRHDFVFGSTVAGPNVFVDGVAERAHDDIGPHHRWSSGGLFDNITTSRNINVRNRGNWGTGHGWAGANMVIWNSRASEFIVQSPPTAQNWIIGSVGRLSTTRGPGIGRLLPPIADSHDCPVEPQSLYAAQLADRMAFGGVQVREYWLGDIDDFFNDGSDDYPYVDPTWWDAVVSATDQTPIGFDDLTSGAIVPFTVKLSLKQGEAIVGAKLTLALRASGPAADLGTLYLGDLDHGFAYADLGWEPLSTTETGVRVVDLNGQLDVLQSGQLNVALGPDTAVDWAMLSLKIIPAPAVLVNSIKNHKVPY